MWICVGGLIIIIITATVIIYILLLLLLLLFIYLLKLLADLKTSKRPELFASFFLLHVLIVLLAELSFTLIFAYYLFPKYLLVAELNIERRGSS
jgi:hypothetical protein